MTKKSDNPVEPLIAADIFAGGGGLTVGLKRAGFEVCAAIEVEQNALSTYKANHPEVFTLRQDVRLVNGNSIRDLSSTGEISLLAGCPPCQGFSTLTKKHLRFDPRNRLVREMARLIEETQPHAVMMENVPGMVRKGNSLFNNFLKRLKSLGYIVNWDVLQVADFGVPQNRRRLVLLAGKEFEIALPDPTHSKDGTNGLKPWRSLRDAIGGLPEPIPLKDAKSKGGPQSFNWHVVRNLSPQNILRLEHTEPGKGRAQLPIDLRPDCHKESDEGYHNVYGRMSWDQVPVTITGGCTTLSKGRFGHPERCNTISVREAALIQTFPLDYCIDTPYMDYACNIVGNALPCDFAEVVAKQCAAALRKNLEN